MNNYLQYNDINEILNTIINMSDETLLEITKEEFKRVNSPSGREFLKSLLIHLKHKLPYLAPNVQKSFIQNFFINYLINTKEIHRKFTEKYGFRQPLLIVISPTMVCNLKCYGCYSSNYSKVNELSTEKINQVIREAKELGIYFFVISGGEPFLHPDLMNILETHKDAIFHIYTNGSLIDKEKSKRLAELGNAILLISVEGFEEETDKRRGKGHYKKVINAMNNLREYGVLFGFSATATRENSDLIVSEEFMKHYFGLGCFLGWIFQYMPIGRKPDLSLMPTPEQRNFRRHKVNELRSKGYLIADFWNDGVLARGCLAGGSVYLHINAKGDVEPCVFAQFAIDNINNKSLLDIILSDYFKDIRDSKLLPERKNELRPCMLIDHPSIFRDIVKKHNAYPTQDEEKSIIKELALGLDNYAKEYKKIIEDEENSKELTYNLYNYSKDYRQLGEEANNNIF